MLVSADSQWLAAFPLPWDSHCAWAKLHLQSTPSSSKCPQGRKWLACEPRLTSKLQYLVRISTVLRNLKPMISDHFLSFSSCFHGRVGVPPPTTSNSGQKFSPVATLPFQPVHWVFLVFLPHFWRLLLTLLVVFMFSTWLLHPGISQIFVLLLFSSVFLSNSRKLHGSDFHLPRNFISSLDLSHLFFRKNISNTSVLIFHWSLKFQSSKFYLIFFFIEPFPVILPYITK